MTSYNFKEIAAHCNKYKGAETGRSLFQLTTTLGLFIASCSLMLYGLSHSYWITALFILPTSGLLVRIFIFQHDCGHQSFFDSKKANNWTGRLLSVLTFVPYDCWRRAHNLHHATSGDLERSGIGDIDVLTVKEYEALSKGKQRLYRLYRHPLFLIFLGTPLYTLILQRIPYNNTAYFRANNKRPSLSSTWKSTVLTDFALIAFYGALAWVIGITPLLLVYVPVLIVTGWFYGWGFYVQHQFEDTYWETHENWNIHEAALMGSSYYVLPKIIKWFSGNIGLHHIHHMCNKIPNYKLQECMDARPELKDINRITIRESLKCASLKLWDEETKKLIKI